MDMVFSEELRASYLPIRQNGSRFFKRMILKQSSHWDDFQRSGLDEHQFLATHGTQAFQENSANTKLLSFAFVQNPVQRVYDSYIDHFLAVSKSVAAESLTKTWLSNQDPAIEQAEHRPFSFLSFVKALFETNDENLPDAFRSQSSSLEIANGTVDWIVPLERHPQFLTMLEEHAQRRIAPRKARFGYRTQAIDRQLQPWRMHADHLRSMKYIPDFDSLVRSKIAKLIESRFAQDVEIYRCSVEQFPTNSAQTRSESSNGKERLSAIYASVRQISSKTSVNRYPEIFRFASELLYKQNVDQPKILSFGCSTGEECESLLEYFPDANIVGLDIRSRNIDHCKSKIEHPQIAFDLSNDDSLAKHRPFDVVFAMSVLCRWPDTLYQENCESFYRFEQFQSDARRLANAVAENGLLVIYNSNFRFDDTEASALFKRIEMPDLRAAEFVTKFSTTNRKLDEPIPFAIYHRVKNE